MAKAIGRLLSFGIGKETVRGTAVAPDYWLPVTDVDLEDHYDTADNESGFGNIAKVNDSMIVKKWGEGSIEGKFFDKSGGRLLGLVFGGVSVPTQRATSGVYDHAFTMANNNSHLSGTFTVKDPNNDVAYPNGVIDEIEFTLEDEYFMYSTDLKSKPSASSSTTPAYIAENEFTVKHAVVKIAAVGGDLDAASAIGVKEFSLTISKNADELQELGSINVVDVVNKELEVEFELSLYYNDTTYRTLALNNTRKALRIDMINTDVTIGSTHNPAVRFEMPEVLFTEWEKDFDNDDILVQNITGKAVFNLSAGAIITGRLTNTVSAAY